MKIEELKTGLANMEDPHRTDRGNIRHKLEDIIIIGLCTLICDGNDFADMEEFGVQRQELLSQFLELPNGIPVSDTFRRVFERLNPESLSECLYDWLSCNRKEGSVIAIDGKTIRRSRNKSHKAYHVVSAFVAENQITLGDITTDEKSNEITAVPELLDSLNISGSIVTADAMSCQKKNVQKIRDGSADYVIALKENQPALQENVSLYFDSFADELPVYTTTEKDHGRIEKREHFLLTDLSWLPEAADWAGLCAVGIVKSTVIRSEKTSTEKRYYITSLNNVDRFAYAVCAHWSIENQLHWRLDVIVHEDASRAKKDFSPLNLNVLRKTALALCKGTDMGKRVSMQKKRFRASLNPDAFLHILLG